jgi:AraC-like DNA-binding protein
MTALATAIRPLWTLIESYGEDPAEIFDSVGIDPTTLRESNARLPVAACNAAWLRASTRIHDPAFGVHYGEHWRPAMFGSLGYAWLASVSLRRALHRASEYFDMLIERGSLEVKDLDDGQVLVALSYRGNAFTLPALADSLLSTLVKLCRISCGDDFNPSEILLFHSAPPDPSAYFSYFKCPVRFDADVDGIVLPQAILDEPLPGGNKAIAAMIDQETVRYLGQLDRSKVVERVQAAITERLASGRVASETVAADLHVSNRTLNRQLQAEGTTFKAVMDKTRQKLADAYLAESQSITQIAFSLGFSDQTSFTRAYKRWTGQTPSEARA